MIRERPHSTSHCRLYFALTYAKKTDAQMNHTGMDELEVVYVHTSVPEISPSRSKAH